MSQMLSLDCGFHIYKRENDCCDSFPELLESNNEIEVTLKIDNVTITSNLQETASLGQAKDSPKPYFLP